MPAQLPHRRLRALALVAVGAAAGALVFGTVSLARTQAEITVCVAEGTRYLYTPPPGRSCPAGSLTWNQQGPAGAQGPAGPQGQPGPPGPASSTASVLSAGMVKVVSSATQIKAIQNGGGATAKCPSGYRAVGGGGYAHSGGVSAQLSTSKPWWPNGIGDEKKGLAPRGWSVYYTAKPANKSWFAVASAVCARSTETKVGQG